MDLLDTIRDLHRHMEWADAIVWRAVLGAPAARADAAIRDRQHHTHHVQRAFLAVWRRTAFDRHGGDALDLAGLARWGRAYHEEAAPYLAGLSAASLDEPVVLPWAARVMAESGRQAGVTTRGETLLQVAAHSLYHRGQTNARLRELGVEPPLADFIAWIWLGRPAPEWPGEIA
jgi:uncharacterized damage-inducible protein DinB